MRGLFNQMRRARTGYVLLLCCGLSFTGLGSEISGFVRDDRGVPLGDISVFAFALTAVSGETYFDTFTDTNGAFRLQVEEGTWFVQVDSFTLNELGYRGASPRSISVAGTNAHVDFVCPQAVFTAQLEGQALDDNGAPLARVTIRAGSSEAIYQTTSETDAGGYFSMPVFGGIWNVAMNIFGAPNDPIPPEVNWRVIDGVSRTNVVLLARRPTIELTGTVEDPFGQALTNVAVRFSTEVNGTNYHRWYTRSTGTVLSLPLFEGRWRTEFFLLNGTPSNVLKVPSTIINVMATNAPLVIRALPVTARLSGRVVDQLGQPQTNVVVSAFTFGQAAGVEVDASAEGRFDLGVFGGLWRLQARSDSPGRLSPQLLEVEVQDGVDQTNLTLVVRRASLQLTGSVRNPGTGTGIPNVEIRATTRINAQDYAAIGWTDRHGEFRIDLFEGEWRVHVDPVALNEAGYQQTEAQLVTVNSNTTLQVAAIPFGYTTRVRGKAMDVNGNPFSFVRVAPYGPSFWLTPPVTAQDGTFEFHLPAGSWIVDMGNIEADGKLWLGPKRHLELANGLGETNITLVALAATSEVTGLITETNGMPLADIFLYASVQIGETNYFSTGSTDPLGHYEFGVIDGRWTVHIFDSILNNRGFQSLPDQEVLVAGTNEVLNLVAIPVMGNGRVPRLSSPTGFSNGSVQLTVTSQTAHEYIVEASSNLLTWTPVFTNFTFAGAFTFTDTRATNSPARFYRAVLSR